MKRRGESFEGRELRRAAPAALLARLAASAVPLVLLAAAAYSLPAPPE